MKERKPDLPVRAQQQIRRYLNAQMSEAEQEAFWAFLVENPRFFAHLKLDASLRKLAKEKPALLNQHNRDQLGAGKSDAYPDATENGSENIVEDKQDRLPGGTYTKWIACAVAILALVMGLNLVKMASPAKAPSPAAAMAGSFSILPAIDLKYIESTDTYVGPLLREAFPQASNEGLWPSFQGEAAPSHKDLAPLSSAYRGEARTAKAYMNTNIKKSNSKYFDASVTHPLMPTLLQWLLLEERLDIR